MDGEHDGPGEDPSVAATNYGKTGSSSLTASTADEPLSHHDAPNDVSRERAQTSGTGGAGHVKSQESFSRSRSSTGPASDSQDDQDSTWVPSNMSHEHDGHAATEDIDAAFSSIAPTTSSATRETAVDLINTREELDDWSKQNATSMAAPFIEDTTRTALAGEGDQPETESRQPEVQVTPVVEIHAGLETSRYDNEGNDRPHQLVEMQGQELAGDDFDTSRQPISQDTQRIEELHGPGLDDMRQDTAPAEDSELSWMTKEEISISTTAASQKPPNAISEVVAEHVVEPSAAEENNESIPEYPPFSPKTGDDAWIQALGINESSQDLHDSAPSAADVPFLQAPEGARSITTGIQREESDETMEELRENLIGPAGQEASPQAPDDNGFLDAVKEVSEDLAPPTSRGLEPSSRTGMSAEAEPAWLTSAAPHEDVQDSWEKELASPNQGGGEISWDSAFGDALDDDGFLDDEDGFLDDGIDGAAVLSAGNPSRPAEVSQSNPYDPATPSIANPYATGSTFTTPLTQPTPADQSRPAPGGMKFFEDLPMTQPTRTKKPRQLVPTVQSSGAAPPSVARAGLPPTPPQRQSSIQQGPYSSQLVGPQKLEMFPPQPSQPQSQPLFAAPNVALTSPHASSLQPPAATNARYSPAPTQPNSSSPSARYATVPPTAPPAVPTRYSPTQPRAPGPSQAPTHTQYEPNVIPQSHPGQDPNVYSSQQSRGLPQQPPAPPRLDSRYSSAPPPQPPPSQPPLAFHGNDQSVPGDGNQQAPLVPPPSMSAQRFIPRTSSPLRPGTRPSVDRSQTVAAPTHQNDLLQQPPRHPAPGSGPSLLRTTTQAGYAPHGLPTQSSVSLPLEPTEAMPQRQKQPPSYEPPQRPRTQSPEASRNRFASARMDPNRKASLQDPSGVLSPPTAHVPVPFTTMGPSSTDNVNFVQPTDPSQVNDVLSRWKGSPSVQWCPGGSIATHFPKHVPRYGGGQSAPAIKCSPGEIKILKSKEAMPADESLRAFPGPLKSKSKKKELLAWLSTRIENLQRELATTQLSSMDPRASERLLLWQVVRVVAEHDGVLTGTPTVDLAVRQLFPTTVERREGTAPAPADRPAADIQPNQAKPVQDVRQHLLQGDREKAVWQAVDAKLWGHAMLISSTMDGALWKQVAQEFIRTEVRSSTDDNKSLAALYAIFAHNWDESIDELVPASARAGFQMVPAAGIPTQSPNTLDGLNKWQETLSLILANRSTEDEKGLLALGRLLRGYGRIEAAHVCFIFSRSVTQLGGVDDPDANFTLLGTDVGADAVHDIDAILLSESYEYATSLIGSTTTHYMPHLQAYKLHHAHALADAGHRTEALQYCDAISAAIKSTTRPSPYYHPVLITQLDDLAKRLSQSPKDSSSSWMSKPSLGKVGGGMWAKFNNFVAGDDDAASNGSGQPSENEAGLFSRFTGGTPTISRTASFADISTFVPAGPASGNSRYAPSYSSQAPASANYQQPTVTPRDARRPSSSGHSDFRPPLRSDSFHPPQSSYNPAPQASHHLGIADNMSQASSSYDPPILHPPPGFTSDPASGSPYETHSSSRAASSHGPPSLPSQDHEMSIIDEEGPAPKMNGYQPIANDYAPSNGLYGSPYQPQDQASESGSYAPQQGMYEPASSGGYDPAAGGDYNPSTGGGYEPPSGGYQPYEPTSPSSPTSPERAKLKKKRFMDDDEDDYKGNSGGGMGGGAQAASQTREPDDAARRAAEADAARDKAAAEAKKSGSWIPSFGLFGRGNKDPNAPVVHKAKLGEESSFYFDPEAKKWVNKKAGASSSTPAAAATPPPPRAGPPMGAGSRAPSGPGTTEGYSTSADRPHMGIAPPMRTPSSLAGTPPMASAMPIPGLGISHTAPSDAGLAHQPSRTGTPASDAGSALPPLPNTGLQPPSRPSTSMSNASSIDDLIGAPGARKGGTIKKGKKGGGRYVDVMAK